MGCEPRVMGGGNRPHAAWMPRLVALADAAKCSGRISDNIHGRMGRAISKCLPKLHVAKRKRKTMAIAENERPRQFVTFPQRMRLNEVVGTNR